MTKIITTIVLGIFFLEHMIGWIVLIFHFFRYTVRCRNVRHCKNTKCLNRPYCQKIAFTTEEIERIQKQIDKME